ncbi:MAG TPA: hypothetical protein VGC75_04870, partial [Candidatus Nitrosocosmicus sp.]
FVSIGAIFPGNVPAWQFIGNYGELGITKAAELFMPYGGFIVLIGGIVSTLAALNATTFSSARVAFAMGRHYNLPHKLSAIHPKFKTPYVSVILSTIIMAVMAYALPLNTIAQASAVIFLLLFTQVNISVITIRRMYGDKLDYGFKTPFFPIIPIIGIILMIGLALYLLVTAPFSWVITALWVLVGFTIYRIFTFRKEVEHYSPLLTSEGNLVKKDFKILLPYTPENPDRLVKYAIRIAKEKDAEINIIRTITVPHQTPLSAGIAFVDSSKKAFEPLEKILNNENIIYHFLVRITHDATEAILSTTAEQKINFLIIDYETIKNNKKLQTLLTCDYLAILPHRDNDIRMEEQNVHSEIGLTKENRKNMVILYDDGDDSDGILKITKWFANTGNFNLNVVAINRKDDGNYEVNNVKPNSSSINDKSYIKYIKRREYFLQAGVELNEIHVSKDIEKDNMQFAKLILKSVVTYNPDIVITESTIGKNSLLTNSNFANLLMYGINCPIIIVKDFSFPLVNILSRIIKQIMGHLGPSYLVRLMRTRMK